MTTASELSGQDQDLTSEAASRAHSVNIRFTLPTFSGRYYVNLLMGPELRSGERLNEERAKHPIGTWSNRFFLFAVGAIFGFGGLVIIFDGLLFVLRLLGFGAG